MLLGITTSMKPVTSRCEIHPKNTNYSNLQLPGTTCPVAQYSHNLNFKQLKTLSTSQLRLNSNRMTFSKGGLQSALIRKAQRAQDTNTDSQLITNALTFDSIHHLLRIQLNMGPVWGFYDIRHVTNIVSSAHVASPQ